MHPLPIVVLALLLTTVAAAQPTFTRLIDDFEAGDISAWQTSMSPEYYRGGTGQKGLEVIQDPDRGKVLRCDVRFVDERGSEPAFITRRLDPKPNKLDVVGVRFWAKLTEAAIAPKGGFKVRLRTGDTSFTDYDVQDQLGKPFPVGEWVRVELDTKIGPEVRNIWGKLFGTIRQMTFRLDDIDDRNSHFALLVDDIELVMKQPPAETTYAPKVRERKGDQTTRILFLKHRAAGYYNMEQAIGQVAPDAEVDTFFYRGLHFEFFGFPESAEQVLPYDAIIMLDVDPFMMTWEQCAWVADAVVSGAHLLLFGGPVTLTHSKDFKAPLQAVLPVTFEPDAKDIGINAPPQPQGNHFLNEGFDPAGLGVVASMQSLSPREGAEIPWTVKEQPLVITGPIQRGRATIVNTWPRVDRSPTGDFFTSTLSDDLMRRLIRYALGRTDGTAVVGLELPELVVVGGGTVKVRARYAGAGPRGYLAVSEGRPGPGPLDPDETSEGRLAADGWEEFTVELPPTKRSQTPYHFRLEAPMPAQGRGDSRDFVVEVRNPLKLAVELARNKCTFAPGSPVELTVNLSRRDLPTVRPGARTIIEYAGGKLPVSIDNFVDSWVYKPGTDHVIHNQVGDANVKVEAHGGLLPSWTVSGQPRSARAKEDIKFAEDDRILRCNRRIQVKQAGAVQITTDYEFLQDMKAQRLPLCVSLPVSIYAGMKYTVEQAEGVREGVFPVESKRGIMFNGHGLKMTIGTPRGPVSIEVLDPSLRVWMRDLRQYDMTVYRLEIEAPYENREAKSGEKYTIPLVISGTVPGAPQPSVGAASSPDLPSIIAALVDPHTGYRWAIPCTEKGVNARFAGELPNLSSGEYALEVQAQSEGRTLVSTTSVCHVVDPLDLTDFFPIMSIVGIDGDGHRLDDAGVQARVDDLIAHGFNTAAITGTSNFRAGNPSNSARLKGVAESYAQRRGMATTFEYSNFQLLGRNKQTSPCVFSPEYHEALRQRLQWQIDVGNRTPRLMSAKVTDEPVAGPASMDFCEHCKAEFQRRYGIELKPLKEYGEDPYARWALADFIGEYVTQAYSHSAQIMQEENATFDLLLTYMATGLGYQRPLSYQQDALDWTRCVKWADFDVYPYFYPASQRIRMVQASFAMTYMRDVSRARKVPWGFYMELDDRNWPFQQNPKEATAECGFTAIAHGADYLNSFINRVVSTGCQSRPERWEAAGKALRAIRRIGPMLKHMPPVRASVAILFPNAQQAIGNGYPTPQYTLAALKGGYGECDIHNEEVILESGEIPYKALFLFQSEFIHEDLVPLLKSWLNDGGILICDELPSQTHRGEETAWDFAAKAAPQEDIGPIKWSLARAGKGKLVFIENDINEEFKQLVEAGTLDPAACKAYRLALADLLDNLGLKPNLRVDYSETAESADLIEAGLRGNGDGALVIIVNHQPQAQKVTLTIGEPGIKWLVDVAAMKDVAFERNEDGSLIVQLDVPGRWARIIAGYRAKPERVELKVETPQVKLGEQLRYEVSILDSAGKPVSGGVLLEIEVSDPAGNIVTRFGGSFAPLTGAQVIRVPVPINASKGTYKITARAPQIGVERQAESEVR